MKFQASIQRIDETEIARFAQRVQVSRFQPGFSRECTRFPAKCRTPQCACSYRHCTYMFAAELGDLASLRK